MTKPSLDVVVGVFTMAQKKKIFTRSLKIIYLKTMTEHCNKIVNKKLVSKKCCDVNSSTISSNYFCDHGASSNIGLNTSNSQDLLAYANSAHSLNYFNNLLLMLKIFWWLLHDTFHDTGKIWIIIHLWRLRCCGILCF